VSDLSLTESIDTSGPAGRMLMQMLGSFPEYCIQKRARPIARSSGFFQRSKPSAKYKPASAV